MGIKTKSRLTWIERRWLHDSVAVPFVIREAEDSGLVAFKNGFEHEAKGIRQAVQGQTDLTSLMMRFKPDLTLINRNVFSLLSEVKCETSDYPNFAIEVDSYTAAHVRDQVGQSTMYAMVDLSAYSVDALKKAVAGKIRLSPDYIRACFCRARQIPEPLSILCPYRPDRESTIARLKETYPCPPTDYIRIKPCRGSNTPFFRIPKDSSFLVDFSSFLESLIAG